MHKTTKIGMVSLGVVFLSWLAYQIFSPETRAFINLYSPPEYLKLDNTKPLRDQVRLFEMAGREFQLPIMYINGSSKPQKHQDSMLLQVIWPDMKAVAELGGRDEYKKVLKEEKRWGQILLEPATLRPSLDTQIENRRKFIQKEQRKNDYLGLEQYDWYSGQSNNLTLSNTVFIRNDERGNIIDLIMCRGELLKFRICEHKFLNRGIIFEIDYNESRFLKEWSLQRDRAINFINSFEINSKPLAKSE